jgi:hypothetical protein
VISRIYGSGQGLFFSLKLSVACRQSQFKRAGSYLLRDFHALTRNNNLGQHTYIYIYINRTRRRKNTIHRERDQDSRLKTRLKGCYRSAVHWPWAIPLCSVCLYSYIGACEYLYMYIYIYMPRKGSPIRMLSHMLTQKRQKPQILVTRLP